MEFATYVATHITTCVATECLPDKISGVKMVYHYRFAHGWFPEMPLKMEFQVEVG